MPYIGRGLVQGNYVKLDDLQSQFDGSKTTFTLSTGGLAYTPGSANTLLVSLGGVIQEAVTSYTVVNDQITFSNPPTADANIFIIALGSVNFQLGTRWMDKFPSAYRALASKDYDEAIRQVSTGSGRNGQSRWKEQTPVRVEDFVIAIDKLR